MCIIAYKQRETAFPTKETLKTCFRNNPDGAGFMYANNGAVTIHKGFMNFKAFWNALRDARAVTGDNIPYVMHFRITTQAGTRPDCCHPFPLSSKMDDLRKLKNRAKIGIAHNGIIQITSNNYSKTITHNDTMEFITEYLSLIIDKPDYYTDKKTLAIITKLCDSRLAILDGDGHCELIGHGWTKDENGVIYSNTSYLPKTPLSDDYYSFFDYVAQDDEFAEYINRDGTYSFIPATCPLTLYGDDSYCYDCTSCNKCYFSE